MLSSKTSSAYVGLNFNTAKRKELINEMLLNQELVEIRVEDVKYPFYVLKEDEHLLYKKADNFRVEFIAPLDNFIWDRNLIKTIFNFDYRWEIYHRPEKRKFAPYAMPILYGTDLIGQISLTIDRENHILKVNNIWYKDQKPTKDFEVLFMKRLSEFAAFNECIDVDFDKAIINTYT